MTVFRLIILFCCLSAHSYCQFNDSTNYYTNLTSTGIINKTNDRDAYLLTNSFRFSIYKKSISLNSGTSFIFGKQNDMLSNQDFTSALDFNVYNRHKKFYYWGLTSYEKNFSLKLDRRFQSGAGVGYNLIDRENALVILSDGVLYESSNLTSTDPELPDTEYETFRNSLRLKFRFIIRNKFTIDGTDFLQHSLSDEHDYIVKSSTNLSYKFLHWLSFTTSINYNKLSVTGRENLLINFGLTIERYF
jgi:hypothetical protein